MKTPDGQVLKGKYFLILLAVVFIIDFAIYVTLLILHQHVSGIGGVITFGILYMVLFFMTGMGIRWTRWVLSVFLLLYGAVLLIEGIDSGNIFYSLLAIPNFYTALMIHLSVHIKAYYKVRNEERTGVTEHFEEATVLDIAETMKAETHDRKEMVYSNIAPTLLRRVQSSIIDFMLVLIALLVIFSFTESFGDTPLVIKVIILLIALSYEPVLTTFYCTLGQKILGIRVKDYGHQSQKIPLYKAYIRLVSKMVLGWLSFLTIHANTEKRAIHDYLAGSVMLDTFTSKPAESAS